MDEVLEAQFEEYARSVAQSAVNELKPKNVVSVPGVSDDRLRRVLRGQIKKMGNVMSKTMKKQQRAVLRALDEPEAEEHRRDYLEYDPIYANYEGTRVDEYEAVLLDRLDRILDDLDPVASADEDDFWDKMAAAYDRDEAVDNLQFQFDVAEPQQEFHDGVLNEIEVADVPFVSGNIDFTDESFRIIAHGVGELHERIADEADEAYD